MTGKMAQTEWTISRNTTEQLTSSATPDVDEDLDLGHLRALVSFYSLYPWLIPVSIGLPGNFLAILVTRTPENRKNSACTYMLALAVADSICLIHECLIYVSIFWGYDIFLSDPKKRELYLQ